MSRATAQILHRAASPISVHEFRDAVQAVCRPRFPTAHYARPQRIALAVSGGVDSMAMAYLFSNLLRTYKGIKIADNPAEGAYAIVVDHGLRQSSTKEAYEVSAELKRIGLKAIVKVLNWKEQRWQGIEPSTLPNIEGVARTMRYQALGTCCRYLLSSSLFFAHHFDDQYETVLMRLLAGHGHRGLLGIRQANAIPECYELHGVYKSGLLDDQTQKRPFLSFKPATKEMRRLRHILKADKDAEPWDQIRSYLGLDEMAAQFPGNLIRDFNPHVPYITPLYSEEGGVTIYRPLLEFDKARLIATCEANSVKWFEDHTNRDPTLTTRNAIRYLTKNHSLPKALQKSSIIGLAKRIKQKIKMQEAEAHRMLVRQSVVEEFDPNAGTLSVELPTFQANPATCHRPFSEARDEARKPRRRLIAAIVTRKLIEFVTPERHLPPLANLEGVVDRLFPELSLVIGAVEEQPLARAFSIAGVLFDPLASEGSRKWFLSRAPYPSTKPLPERKLPGYLNYRMGFVPSEVDNVPNRHGHWRSWKTAKIWDGRFWIRVSACVAARFHLLPFQPAYAKPFRMALPPKERVRLERILKHFAPGKVRYSLPALYSVETPDEEGSEPILTLLALPSLGIHVPGLERWVKYEARYKNIDASLLARTKSQPKSSFLRRFRSSSDKSRQRPHMSAREPQNRQKENIFRSHHYTQAGVSSAKNANHLKDLSRRGTRNS